MSDEPEDIAWDDDDGWGDDDDDAWDEPGAVQTVASTDAKAEHDAERKAKAAAELKAKQEAERQVVAGSLSQLSVKINARLLICPHCCVSFILLRRIAPASRFPTNLMT